MCPLRLLFRITEFVRGKKIISYIDLKKVYRSNEEDTRSVASRRSGSSGSPKARDSTPAEEEEEDLWTVWGELIRNWDQEVKKNPQYIKVKQLVFEIEIL